MFKPSIANLKAAQLLPATGVACAKQRGRSYVLLVVILLFLVIAGGLTWWFRTNYERVTLDPELELSEQVAHNRFYAAELYLTKLGINTQTERGRDTLINLPSTQDTLVIKSMGQSFNNQRIENLVKWMEQGGQIITFTNGYWYDDIDGVASISEHAKPTAKISNIDDEQDIEPIVYEPYYLDDGNKLLDYLGVYYYYPEDYIDCGDDEDEEPVAHTAYDERCYSDEEDSQNENKAKKEDDDTDRRITMQLDGKTIEVYLDPYKAILWINPDLKPIKQLAKYHNEPQMVQFAIGKGRLTVFSDSQFMQNPSNDVVNNILNYRSVTKPKQSDDTADDKDNMSYDYYYRPSLAEANNAYLLWYLVKDSHKVWLLPDIDNKNLFELLWAKAKYACISFAVLLLFWLWWQMRRFGPIKQQLDLPRRNLIEHLNMVGLFAWRLDKANRLLSQNRHGLKKTLLTHYPKLTQLEAKDFSHQLSEHIDMPAATIYKALFAPINSESDFIQVTHLMQQLTHQL